MAEARRRRSGSAARAPRGERRRKLLDAARKLFAAHGYVAVTPDDVAAAAGVTPGQLARSFPAKIDLLRAVCDDLRAAAFAHAPPEGDGPTDPLTQLHAITENFARATRDRTDDFRIVIGSLEAPAGEDVRSVVAGFLAGAAGELERVIRTGQQAGVFRRSPDPAAAAREAVRHLLGLALLWPFEGFAPGPADPPAQAIDLLLHGLMKTDV
jgi:AcrR family transcriptional regulator